MVQHLQKCQKEHKVTVANDGGIDYGGSSKNEGRSLQCVFREYVLIPAWFLYELPAEMEASRLPNELWLTGVTQHCPFEFVISVKPHSNPMR